MKIGDTVIFVSGLTDKIRKAYIIGESKTCWKAILNKEKPTENIYLFNKDNLLAYGITNSYYKNKIRELKPEDEEIIERQKLLSKVSLIYWDLQDTSLLREVYNAWKNYYAKKNTENNK